MFHVLSIYFPLAFVVQILINLIKYITGTAPEFSDWIPLFYDIGIYLFFNIGIIYCITRLSASIRKSGKTKNRYTRVIVPSFLFVPMADIFMIITALFNGKNIFSLLKKDEYNGKKLYKEK